MAELILSPRFKTNVKEALENETLQDALSKAKFGFINRRKQGIKDLPEFEELRDAARDIKNHTLKHLDLYYEAYEEKLSAAGGKLHFAVTAKDARDIVTKICRDANAKSITKGKSMITEEIHLNDHLERQGFEVIETDLGEYIIQLRGERPSHIVAPAVHVSRDQVEKDFRENHTHLDADRSLEEAQQLIQEARAVLRQKYQQADVGITGANFLVAETGTSVIVTNEGNGDLTQSLPRVHIVVTSLEKIIPTMEDVSVLLRVLGRSATGQEMSVYTTFSTGPRREQDLDGPEENHVIVLDNGRSSMLGGEFEDMLRCIRCGACMNHCPVYQVVGGHAYGWVYPGPMGSVLTPQLIGVDKAGHLPNASTFCGRCEAVCPVRIPLPRMMRSWRNKEFESGLVPKSARYGLGFWKYFAKRPRLYKFAASLAIPFMSLLGGFNRKISHLPGLSGWTKYRDFPAPQGRTFHQLLRDKKAGVEQ